MTLAPEKLRPPKHPKFDAIHRALLTGLLSNIGTKSDTYEYLGARGIRFSIHPGSGLFEAKPKWLMSAELVETTKLYARTAAAIQPQWVERVAAHLVERTYSEPRWDVSSQSVIASERVMLYGLVLVAQRPIHYGPINPKISRDLFIHHALVLEELRTEAPFFRHNRQLTQEVRALEDKVRAHNLLADATTRFNFYDARIPPTVTNGSQFESWRKTAEHQTPAGNRLLFMSKEDLLRADAPDVTPTNYPDRSEIFGMKLPLDYKFAPGEARDGITLTVPIAALAQLRPEKYDWLVPGMLEEKITALIKSLPGALRRNFVPVPDFAKAATTALQSAFAILPSDTPPLSLTEALANHLSQTTGTPVTPADFHPTTLPDHLHMAFNIVDDTGRRLAISRHLQDLQRKLAKEANHAFSKIPAGPNQEFTRENVTTWDFGNLPDVVRVQRFKMTIDAYPALTEVPPIARSHSSSSSLSSSFFPAGNRTLDTGNSPTVSLRLFPTGPAALQHHREGLRRLFLIEHRREIRAMLLYLQDLEKMALYYRSLGPAETFRDQLSLLIVDRALLADAPLIRTQTDWETRKLAAHATLLETAEKTASLIFEILSLYHQLLLKLEGPIPQGVRTTLGGLGKIQTSLPSKPSATSRSVPNFYPATLADIHDQLLYLISDKFMTQTPYPWLQEYPRYLKGILSRIEKLSSGPPAIHERDLGHTQEMAPWVSAYRARLEQHRAAGINDHELDIFRWLLEEYRIHLFAQELGTAFSISAKRLEKQWAKVRA